MTRKPKHGLRCAVYRPCAQGVGSIGRRIAPEIARPNTEPRKAIHASARRLIVVAQAAPRLQSRTLSTVSPALRIYLGPADAFAAELRRPVLGAI